jgi:hypothetical protein
MNLNNKRVLALDLRPRSFGFAVFENAELLDWGVKSLRDLAGRPVPAGINFSHCSRSFSPRWFL